VTWLGATTWRDAVSFGPSGVALLVPVGSTEQHGPHLPLTTDTEVADAIVAGAIGRDAGLIGAPAVAYGSSGEHQDFAGTLSIGNEAIELLLVELGRSALTTFERVVFVSTHGGNASALRRALDAFGEDGRARVRSWSPRWSGDLHAGRTETSLMLALAPERVHLERAEAGRVEPAETLLPRLTRVGVRAVSENGVLGDPSGASATEGRELLERAVDDLVAFVESSSVNGIGPSRERREVNRWHEWRS
jgi:mycofactocin precursor peptide peptidase